MIPSSETGAQHLGILWMLELDKPVPAGPEPRLPATFLRAGAEHPGELAEAMGLADPTPVLHRFTSGRQCYIARVEGKLVSYGWITFDTENIGELGLSIRFKKGEAYIWDCATLAAYRGQRLYPALLVHMLRELQRAGLQRTWIGTDIDNLPSQTGVALAGFHPIVDILLSSGQLWSRGRSGATAQNVEDAHYALFGE